MVEYFNQPVGSRNATMGRKEFEFNFTSNDCNMGGANGSHCAPRFTSTFWFDSAENRDKFEANPWKYAPQYGGF
jgi:hypothetical protein